MGILGAAWGVIGVSLLIGSALFRIFPYVQELLQIQLSGMAWFALLVSLIFMGYMEGYRGFQLKFSPRVAARAKYIHEHPSWARILFAPLFCMGFFYATKKRKIISYSLTTMIIVLIVLVRYLEQPWRGIVDAGVLFGLAWGLLSIWWNVIKVISGKHINTSPEVPA